MPVVVLRSSLMSSDEHFKSWSFKSLGYLPFPEADSENRRSPSHICRAICKRSIDSAELKISQKYTSTFEFGSSLYTCSNFLLCRSRECCRDMVKCAGFYSGVWKGKTQYAVLYYPNYFHFLVVVNAHRLLN